MDVPQRFPLKQVDSFVFSEPHRHKPISKIASVFLRLMCLMRLMVLTRANTHMSFYGLFYAFMFRFTIVAIVPLMHFIGHYS